MHPHHPLLAPEQVDGGLAALQDEAREGLGLLDQQFKQGLLTHQGAGAAGIPTEGLGCAEQLLPVDDEAPALQGAVGQGRQQLGQPHGAEGIEPRGHQGLPPKLAHQAGAGFHQGHGQP